MVRCGTGSGERGRGGEVDWGGDGDDVGTLVILAVGVCRLINSCFVSV